MDAVTAALTGWLGVAALVVLFAACAAAALLELVVLRRPERRRDGLEERDVEDASRPNGNVVRLDARRPPAGHVIPFAGRRRPYDREEDE